MGRGYRTCRPGASASRSGSLHLGGPMRSVVAHLPLDGLAGRPDRDVRLPWAGMGSLKQEMDRVFDRRPVHAARRVDLRRS